MTVFDKHQPVRVPIRAHATMAIMVAALLLIADSARSDAVTDWNEIMEQTVANADPFLRLRSAAITQLAVFEAVNSIEGDYIPYLDAVPSADGASAEAAAIAAAHRVLTSLHPDHLARLDSFRDASLAKIADRAALSAGVRVGIAAADRILALRADDGSAKNMPYTPGTEPGVWQPTPPDYSPAYRPGLREVKPFGLEHSAQFRVGPPPPLHSARYARDYDEVRTFGELDASARTKKGTDIARFYELTEPGPIYNPAARQVSAAQGKTLSQNARIFALVNMAIFDAAVACFDSKYFYNFWRPVTAIQAGNLDGNRRTQRVANWQPLSYTLPFPSYPSGHASFAGAAVYILEHLLGKNDHAIVLANTALPELVLHYSSWNEIANDIDDARVFGGIHFRFDQSAGARQGRHVGAFILQRYLRPVNSAQRHCRTVSGPRQKYGPGRPSSSQKM